MDTGCGDSIISTSYVAEARLEVCDVPRHLQKAFQGVGGVTQCRRQVVVPMDELRERTKFWVNGSSPALSSVGRRCMEQGLSFVWPADSTPYFVTP